jgi:hypothetical protein
VLDLFGTRGWAPYASGTELSSAQVRARLAHVVPVEEIAHAFFLGAGSTGSSYRIVTASGTSYTLKLYENSGDGLHGAADAYHRDTDALRLYRQASSMRAPRDTLATIGVVEASDDGHFLLMDDVRGHDVARVLRLTEFTSRRAPLVRESNRRLGTFVSDLQTLGMPIDRVRDRWTRRASMRTEGRSTGQRWT